MIETYVDKRPKTNIFGLKTTTRRFNNPGELTRAQLSQLMAYLKAPNADFDKVRHKALIKAKLLDEGTPYVPSDYPIPASYQPTPEPAPKVTEVYKISDTALKPKVTELFSYDPCDTKTCKEDSSSVETSEENTMSNITTLDDIMCVVKQSQNMISLLLEQQAAMTRELNELRRELGKDVEEVVIQPIELPPIDTEFDVNFIANVDTVNKSDTNEYHVDNVPSDDVRVRAAIPLPYQDDDYPSDGLDDEEIIEDTPITTATQYIQYTRAEEAKHVHIQVDPKRVLGHIQLSNREFKRQYGIKPKEVLGVIADILNADPDIKSDSAEYYMYRQSIYERVFRLTKNNLILQYEDGSYEFNQQILGDVFANYQQALLEQE